MFIALFATKVGQAVRLAPGSDFSGKALHIMEGLVLAFESSMPSFHPIDLCVGILITLAIRLVVYIKGKNAKKFRKDMEYGSARWGTQADIAPYVDPVFANNIILTQTESLTMNNRPSDPKTARNKNVLIIGGSGSGKTRFWLKPNLMQCTSKKYPVSFVVTDPKGSIVTECGKMLLRFKYKLKIFNTINFKKSMHYNPFAYIHSEKDILKLVTALIANTKSEGKTGDDFWVKAETLLYTALIGYIHYEAPVEEQCFSTLIEMLNSMEVREDDEEFQNPVDLMFTELEKENPQHFAVRQYKKYKLAAGKTAKSILISCGARLAPFDIQELRDLTAYDELELDTLGDQKTALFLIMSDTDDTFNFLISLIYTQLFNLLCEKADDVYGGRLPVHVRCLIDECANIGQIPRLEKLVATIRSREISACLVLQAQSQLKAIYKDNADTIIGNMDTSIFLGGKEPTTLKELSAALGKETIDTFNTGESRGREVSHTGNDSLDRGVGHLLGSSLPVGGEDTHCILTGHSGLASQKMFTDLVQLVIGDVFYLNVLGETLAYQVEEINTVLPYDTSLLGITSGKDCCTLVTCTPYGVNTHRLLVRGTRIPYEEAEALVEEVLQEEPPKSSWEQKYLQGLFIGVITALGLAVAIVSFIKIRKKFASPGRYTTYGGERHER